MSGQIGAEEDLFNEKKTNNGKTQNENEQLRLAKEKLRRYYQSQDKLVPLFDDPEQSIDTCYTRLALLIQQQFQQQKDRMIDNQEKEKSEEDKKNQDYKEENGEWPNSLNCSLTYRNQTKDIELQDIWNDRQKGFKICHISIQGKAESGKSVLSQRIAYLWGNYQMWNHQFQYLLMILNRL
ncbi:hypothetical protein RFI_05781 [Reticulomyxa filosa]|uniref:Uncharacterized protein n=1 Tax=Reticulomyxa filosa TaxID=46433 RepID=X6NZN0_RETFI|nr:hypothetical protein RFI_05781 [Reticulomyxa filosa]|eukprot:ETO31338.1 hypothetical protein RFI_05781 [Reticulomyxa filosa]